MAQQIPEQIAHYRILKVVGRGGMGTVYLAEDEKLGRAVALKVLSDYDMPGEDRKLRFLREARAAASIRHPNVATIYEVGENEQGFPYIAMEFCQGQPLSKIMREKPLSGTRYLKTAKQIAEGIAAAHRSGIVHRDIKSANIMIEPDGTAKVLDFGLAKVRATETINSLADTSISGQLFGTVPYLAPEQTRGLPADMRSDLFSLGTVFYEMATGRLPFDAETPLVVLQKIRDEEPAPFHPPDADFPGGVAEVIGRLLQKDPASRYQTAAEVVEDLAAIESDHLITQRETATLKRKTLGRTTSSRKRYLFYGAAALFAMVLIVATFFVSRSSVFDDDVAATATQRPIASLAVLPFHNVAGTASDDFLSVGLADALVTGLQQEVPALNVRPTSAVLQFKQKAPDSKKAADVLEVEGILEGRFLSDAGAVRVNLQLIDTRTGYGIWADTIEGNRGNLIQLIDEVSSRTTAGVQSKLAKTAVQPRSEVKTTSPEAYENYLKARAVSGSLVPEEWTQQIELLKKAIELDPKFAAAYADLAIAMSLGGARGLQTEANIYEKAEWYARQAVRLDPNLPQAHLALGRTLVRFGDRFRESARENLAALRLNPNDPQALHVLVAYFVSTGEMERARCIGDKLIAIDPISPEAKARGYWYVNAVDPDEAIRLSDLALSARETALGGHDIRGMSAIVRGDLAAAERAQKAAMALTPNHFIPKSLAALIAAGNGNRAEAERQLALMKNDLEKTHWAMLRAALCYAKLGDRKQAILWLRKAQKSGTHSWYYLVKHPWFASMQQDREFQEIVGVIKGDLDAVRDDMLGVYSLICK